MQPGQEIVMTSSDLSLFGAFGPLNCSNSTVTGTLVNNGAKSVTLVFTTEQSSSGGLEGFCDEPHAFPKAEETRVEARGLPWTMTLKQAEKAGVRVALTGAESVGFFVGEQLPYICGLYEAPKVTGTFDSYVNVDGPLKQNVDGTNCRPIRATFSAAWLMTAGGEQVIP